jgi:ribosome-associated heat shock protein Hsp15
MDSEVQSVRIDKWLWSVRLYKSRSIASDACARGKVQVNGQPAKASRFVKSSDVITAVVGEILRTVKVIAPIEKRVGAKLVSQFLEDLTPSAEYEKPKEKNFQPFAFRPKGSGRPTKKQRRNIEEFLQ